MKILIVDDDDSLRTMLKDLCEKDGIEAETAADGQSGFNLFRKQDYDILIVDYHMPVMNGLELVQEIRLENQQIPILVLTEDNHQDVANAFRKAGATDFALKPAKELDIISRIHLHIQIANMRKRLESEEDVYSAKGISKGTLEAVAHFLKEHRGQILLILFHKVSD
ncbi:response regulator [Halobacillus shinanisalinarum]|uniref:Response regulator n=1 Tax=Halobacillus shinanisalinarum TaxID=2932258 RepID=A0ABY4H490_9BACI|nr:response regulator [Halobacillus shinanisalinarum]UOQ95275.1 response regulator [Halobacillus shinanisalinarum]